MPYIILYRKHGYFCQGCHDASKSCGPTQNKHETTDCIDMFSLGFHFKTNYFLRSLLMSPWIYYIGRETCSPKIFPSVFFRKSGSSLQLPNVHLPWMKGLCRATNMVSCLSMVNISSIPFHCRWCLLTTSTHFNSWWTSARCFVDEIPRPKARPNSWPIKCWNPDVKFYGRLAAVMRNDLGWYNVGPPSYKLVYNPI